MRITEEEMELRRGRMLHVAYKLFNEHGIEGISLEKIARAAGVSPKSIFRYFSNKAQLVEQTQIILWKEIVDCITAHNLQARLQAANGFDEMEIILLGFDELYKNHSDYLLFSYDYQSYCIRKRIKLPEEHLERMLSDVRPVFLHALERGQKDGSITESLPPAKRFWLIWGIMQYYTEKMVIYTQLYAGENPWEALFPEFMEKVLETLRP